ncbi:MAG: DHHA1 domain-containing protein, partial [Parashewanella sp.]
YTELKGNSNILKLLKSGEEVSTINEGDEAILVLEQTPFYAESGGQVGDSGVLKGQGFEFKVEDTQKYGSAFGHIGKLVSGTLEVGCQVLAEVDKQRRHRTQLNHSVTHLLHAALRQVLGTHVTQKGSLVDPDKLRFDFSHFEAVKPEQLVEVENLVNQQIRRNHELKAEVMDIDAAKEKGAMALFGEKYDSEVRVVTMGDFSIELCGGTHVGRTGDIGLFKATQEAGIAAGVRRIEAVTGAAAIELVNAQQQALCSAASLLKAEPNALVAKLQAQLDKAKLLEKEVAQLKGKLASAASADLVNDAVEVNGTKVLVKKLEGVDAKSLRDLQDQLKTKLGSGIVVLGIAGDAKVNLIAGVSKDLTSKVKAGELVGMVAGFVGGKGGGRPDMAQAGGSQPENLENALSQVMPWISERLN